MGDEFDEFEDLVAIDLNEWIDNRMQSDDIDISLPVEDIMIGENDE